MTGGVIYAWESFMPLTAVIEVGGGGNYRSSAGVQLKRLRHN